METQMPTNQIIPTRVTASLNRLRRSKFKPQSTFVKEAIISIKAKPIYGLKQT